MIVVCCRLTICFGAQNLTEMRKSMQESLLHRIRIQVCSYYYYYSTTTRPTTRLVSVNFALMRVKHFPHDATSPFLSVHSIAIPGLNPISFIALSNRTLKVILGLPHLCCLPPPSSYKRSLIIHLLPLDIPEPPQSTSSHDLHYTLNSESSP
jgi:hypothetical protein